jgi:hypothetical protein
VKSAAALLTEVPDGEDPGPSRPGDLTVPPNSPVPIDEHLY